MASLKKLAIRGTVWTTIGFGGSQILRFASNLILAHLLFPEFFGLMAIVNIFIVGLHLFSDVGIGLNIIQNKRGDEPDFYNTAWTMQVIRGVGLWIVCCILAIPVANLYEAPELRFLIPVVGFSTIISGFNSTALFYLERHLLVKKQTLIEFTTQIVGLTVMVGWALVTPSVWALAAGGLASAVIKVIWSHWLVPEVRNRFVWDKSAVNEIFSVGQWVFMSTALTFTAEQADRLMMGKLFPLALLGVYQIALTLSDVPRQVVLSLGGKVIFPAISKSMDQPREEVIGKILKSRRFLLAGIIALMVPLIGFGDLLIGALYDERYSDGTWMLPILAIGIWPRLLSNTSEPYLFALGKFQYSTLGNFFRLLCTVIGIGIGSYYLGALGAVIAIAANDLFYYATATYGLIHEKLNPLLQDFSATLILLSGVATIYAARLALGIDLPFDQVLEQSIRRGL